MLKIMFLCTGNSCRSQMAEGFTREFGRGLLEVHSAGLLAARVHPRAVKVMHEAGVDISGHYSKEIDEELLRQMDIVITLCGNAEAACPATPSAIIRLHWSINDPVGMVGSEDEILRAFRAARDTIKERIENFISEVKNMNQV